MTVAVGEFTCGQKVSVMPVLSEFKPPPIDSAVKAADGPADTRID